MSNHESRPKLEQVDLFLAFARHKDGAIGTPKCIRTIIKDYELDLKILETKLKIIERVWRIHKTVNKRDTQKARIWLIHKLIDNPEYAGCVDSMWRTALLQPNCIAGQKKFLLDIDTENNKELGIIGDTIFCSKGMIREKVKTPNGFHYITLPFDTREVLKLKNVKLLRDGYLFIKKVE
jgi:hypothetical protein